MTVTNVQAFYQMMDKCDIYFEDSLISREHILKKYSDFFALAFGEQEPPLSVAQHTGSVCFDVVSFLIAALGCIALNETDNDEIISSLEDGQIVLLSNGKAKERCIWRGFATGKQYIDSNFETAEYAKLEQDSNNMTTYLSRSNWNRISPYFGTSTRTDGRGLRKVKSNRNDFISYLFDVPVDSVSSVIGASTVVVTDKGTFERIANGVRLEYGDGKSVGLLDLVTASYYTSNLEEHQIGANPAKTEPILKITSRVSAARDLVLDKSGNKTVGFMVIGADSTACNNSELLELLERKSLKFSMLSASVDSNIAQEIIKTHEDASIFVCTKEFLLQKSCLPVEKNQLTIELDSQIEKIVNNMISEVNVEDCCSWQDIKALKSALFAIRRSEIRSEDKDEFIITAHALINLIMTALFPLGRLNMAIETGEISSRATTPAAKLDELWQLADRPTEMVDQFLFVADLIERLYRSILSVCPKYDMLVEIINDFADKKIAIVVPKAYYADILLKDDSISENCSTIMTANNFKATEQYDAIIVAGDFSGTHFDPLNCRSASDIIVLLYNGEARFFTYKKRKSNAYEKSVNMRLGLESQGNDDELPEKAEAEMEEVESIASEEIDLDRYIADITTFDVRSFAQKVAIYTDDSSASEAFAVGHFLSGEHIIFTKYYQATVFSIRNGTVSEEDVESLSPGDTIVFAKRDDNTKSMVDYIYNQLQMNGKLSSKVLEATEKAQYWKLALREFKEENELSYRDLAIKLRELGLSIQEVSVRQWLIEESHIVGPREEKTLEKIAELTGDPYLLQDTNAYFEACEAVRKQRKNILKLIGRAIVDKLRGFVPMNDDLLEIVFENVSNLSETLELDDVYILDSPVPVPANFTNRPIHATEVML